jgi:hypothetical protein
MTGRTRNTSDGSCMGCHPTIPWKIKGASAMALSDLNGKTNTWDGAKLAAI